MNRKHQRAEMALHRERVSDSFQELLAGTEDLLRSTASYTGSEVEAARARLRREPACGANWTRRASPRANGRAWRGNARAGPAPMPTSTCMSMPGSRWAWRPWSARCWGAA